MMPCKNRIGKVIKVSAAVLTLISLTMRLSLILATLDDRWTITFGTANSRLLSHLAYRLVAFGIVNEMS
jgi:hypothetical protein